MDESDQPVSLPITDVLDLHTVPPRDARAITEEYLLQARERGYRYVRIIHGKGIGFQRDMVRTLLKGLPFVTSFSDAPVEAGGWGATVVTLRAMAADVDDSANTACP
ncbi:MAG: Smr/MutS family protein [Bryobacterales bacterium]|nr:Smr/MutS family protein [Bryobacterales bacterium]